VYVAGVHTACARTPAAVYLRATQQSLSRHSSPSNCLRGGSRSSSLSRTWPRASTRASRRCVTDGLRLSPAPWSCSLARQRCSSST